MLSPYLFSYGVFRFVPAPLFVLPALALPAPLFMLLDVPTPVRLVSLAFPMTAPVFEFPEPLSVVPVLPAPLVVPAPVPVVVPDVPLVPDVLLVLPFALFTFALLTVVVLSEPHALRKIVRVTKTVRAKVRRIEFPPVSLSSEHFINEYTASRKTGGKLEGERGF